MPTIQEYGAPDRAEGPNNMFTKRQVGEGGSWGQDLANFGAKLGDQMDKQYQRNVQEEVSNAQVDVSTMRAEFQMRLDKQIRSGDVDTGQLQSEYKDYTDKLGEKYQTDEVRRMFARESAQTGAMLTRNAIGAQAVLKGKQAEDNWRTSMSAATAPATGE